MNPNQTEYSNSFFTDTIHGLPIPNKKKLKELSLILPHVFPDISIPMRLPEFINKLTNKKYPDYFIFAVLAAGINYIIPTKSQDYKQLETKYATKSIELMKKETDISNPLIVWASVFITVTYSYGAFVLKLPDQARDIAEMAVKKTKLYQLDLDKNLIKFKYKYTEDDTEFRRRVWWGYYFHITANYIFNGNFIKFEQRDIVVDLPKNDFKYRYGGSFEGCNDKELKLLNDIANDPSDENNPKDCHYLIANSYGLYKNITAFVTKRWRKNGFDEDGANLRLVLMFIYLYQSELVRDQNIKIRPERVKSAKKQCIDASIKQMELLEWYTKNVSSDYEGFPNIFLSLNSLISLTNFFFIQDPSLKEKHTDYFNRIVSIYKSLQKNSDIVSLFLGFVNSIIAIKTKASEENKKYMHLEDYMKPFGISEHDLEPWIIPKYGSFLHSHCCGMANFSTLDIGEYLGEISPTENISKNELYIAAHKGLTYLFFNDNKPKAEPSDGYLSQINRTVLDLTNNFQIKKSIVIDTGFDIKDFFPQKPSVFDPSFLVVNRGLPKSNPKPMKNKKIRDFVEPLQRPANIFENEQKSKRKRNNVMRVESLLNED
ncbi:hypothetical protein BB558_002176 [Smittium angustum]|uniref:Transcription factor domain-containing protein n=1 Tax=Smittium angustum TaxID=133377 RepID=A0A2U1J9L4_SMIAN|nr:hypothetical protein BB558_002176 [Smittium angustum]